MGFRKITQWARRSGVKWAGSVALAGALSVVGGVAQATSVTAFEANEGGPGNGQLSRVPLISHHTAGGPVLADDFVPAVGGRVSEVTWWGSAAESNSWEITFHANTDANEPGFPYISQHFVDALGSDPDGDGIFQFDALWSPLDLVLTSGAQYWFSVANAADNWEWALAGPGSPQVGTENFSALESVGGAPSVVPGPHDGPWALPTCPTCGAEVEANLAFRVAAVPLPAGLPLLLSAFAGLAGLRLHKRRTAAV